MTIPKTSTILYANAIFSFSSAVALASFQGWIAASVIDLPAAVFSGLAGGLLLFAIFVFYLARNQPAKASLVWHVFWGDIAWIAATPVVMIVMADRITSLGNWILLDIALAVTIFAILERKAIKRQRMTGGSSASGTVA